MFFGNLKKTNNIRFFAVSAFRMSESEELKSEDPASEALRLPLMSRAKVGGHGGVLGHGGVQSLE